MFASFLTTSFIPCCSLNGGGSDLTDSNHSGLTGLEADVGVRGAASTNNPFYILSTLESCKDMGWQSYLVYFPYVCS